MIKNFTTFQEELSNSRRIALIEHFNEIYECTELTLHEMKIAFLAYLWKNGQIVHEVNGPACMLGEHGVELEDYQITIEATEEYKGGINLDLLYKYYGFEIMIPMIL